MALSDENTRSSQDSRILEARKAIDEIDAEILDLINQRLLHAREIGRVKHEKGGRVLDNRREIEIMDRLISLNKGPVRNDTIIQIFQDIISESREIQRPQKVSYLGPEATFTHIAAMSHFGRPPSFLPQTSIRDVFTEVEKGASAYGVVPVENSIEGSVNHTLDLFFESDLKICAEIYQSISHELLSLTGDLNEIEKIYSHPQAFGQCRKWLRRYLPDIPLEECSSTARAAQKASEEDGTAAIASSAAAQIYKLLVVEPGIQDFTHNVTRFLVIGNDETHRTGKDKTSIMFATVHAPGALHRALEPVARTGINMVKLESRPTKHENWNYFFFVDIEGHMEDLTVKDTVNNMRELCQYLKCLGSYPKARE
ncbi:MAG: prephenate dehydratase [Deltaproteobacteria bacterium]|nr:prephenate dehydratase [Deltaproteobacteria bacterium]